jgi:SET domain-containing protein
MKTPRLKIKKDSVKGRGVYADELIKKGQIVEVSQLLIVDQDEIGEELSRFVFHYKGRFNAIGLGNGSLYNHSDRPNVTNYFDFDNQLLIFEAMRDITKGEELLINYGYSKQDRKRYNII